MKREALRLGGSRGGRSALKEEYDKDRANRRKKQISTSSDPPEELSNGFEIGSNSTVAVFDQSKPGTIPSTFMTNFDSIFGMTNLDIIKDITKSWIPEEQVAARVFFSDKNCQKFNFQAKKAVEGMIFVNKYSVIDHVIRMDEQILFSKVLWAKKTAAFRELSTDDQVKKLFLSQNRLIF